MLLPCESRINSLRKGVYCDKIEIIMALEGDLWKQGHLTS